MTLIVPRIHITGDSKQLAYLGMKRCGYQRNQKKSNEYVPNRIILRSKVS